MRTAAAVFRASCPGWSPQPSGHTSLPQAEIHRCLAAQPLRGALEGKRDGKR